MKLVALIQSGDRKRFLMHTITVSDLAALVGMVLGTAGFVISLMNHLRDKPKIEVFLKWNMTQGGANNNFGMLKVSNVGRRPVYLGAAALKLPKGFGYTHLVLKESIHGKKLSEGDAPVTYMISYDGLKQYAKHWRKVRGYVEDSAGRKYQSPKLKKTEKPSWAD